VTNLYQLNPFKVHLPSNFNKLTPIKILIHGYGGMVIDKAIKSVREAYQAIGYNVILGMYIYFTLIYRCPKNGILKVHYGVEEIIKREKNVKRILILLDLFAPLGVFEGGT
jgi:hypothetical protein